MSKKVFYLINKGFENCLQVTSTDVIINESSFNDIIKNKNSLKAIVILAELDWHNKAQKDFYGFEIALELRRKYKVLCPLIIISVLKKDYFEKLAENQIKYKILFGRGTAFLPIADNMDQKIADTIENLNKYPLSTPVLTDMNEMLLDQKGFIIDKLTHDLKFGKVRKEIETVLNEASEYLNDTQRSALNWDDFKTRLFKSIGDSDNFNKVKENLISKCDQELMGKKLLDSILPEKTHRIIILEDDPDFSKRIEENLTDYFEEVIVKEKAEDAIEELNKDNTNSITGIIADWRLYKDYSKKTYWQLQGYEVLDYAAKKQFIALFSLTSLHDHNVNSIRNKLGLTVHLFKKQHLQSGGKIQWDMMADTVRQKCDSVFEIISSQPTGSKWKGSLQSEYILHRGSGWYEFENKITTKATELFDLYRNAIGNGDSKICKHIDNEFPLKNNLENVLIIRRVYIGLYFFLVINKKYLQDIKPHTLLGKGTGTEIKHHAIDAFSILRQNWWEDIANSLNSVKIPEAWKKYFQQIKNFRNALCIEMNGLPHKGLLPEEKSWLTRNNIEYNSLYSPDED